MNNQVINNTIQFLNRVDLKWNEVPAFVECMQFLNSLNEEKKEDKPKK